jgi:hypothetical protein
MKREGEEEFLIFGCTENNRGRKVAEVEFTYVQCSVAAVDKFIFSHSIPIKKPNFLTNKARESVSSIRLKWRTTITSTL